MTLRPFGGTTRRSRSTVTDSPAPAPAACRALPVSHPSAYSMDPICSTTVPIGLMFIALSFSFPQEVVREPSAIKLLLYARLSRWNTTLRRLSRGGTEGEGTYILPGRPSPSSLHHPFLYVLRPLWIGTMAQGLLAHRACRPRPLRPRQWGALAADGLVGPSVCVGRGGKAREVGARAHGGDRGPPVAQDA